MFVFGGQFFEYCISCLIKVFSPYRSKLWWSIGFTESPHESWIRTKVDKHGRSLSQNLYINVQMQGQTPTTSKPHRVIMVITTISETQNMLSFVPKKNILSLHTEVNKVAFFVAKSFSWQGTWWVSLGFRFSFTNWWAPISFKPGKIDIQHGLDSIDFRSPWEKIHHDCRSVFFSTVQVVPVPRID